MEKSSNTLLARAWAPGWSHADKALERFLSGPLAEYAVNRKKVDSMTTSMLSPHLHFGELSVRKVFHGIRMKQVLWAKEGKAVANHSANLFLRVVGLREYSRYLCFNFPFTHERSLLDKLKYFPWRIDEGYFKAWRQGRTGYPLVDAGMRELWATGWLHNRIRVVVSSFCVKFLQLPWCWGMKYFWDTLLDADLECDILGWQYISGSLPDGYELDRMENPQIEGYNIDPEGEYVRKWLPELSRLPAEWVHHPWDAPPGVLHAAGVELGCNYPRPIVEFAGARDRLQQGLTEMWRREATSMNNPTENRLEAGLVSNVNVPSVYANNERNTEISSGNRLEEGLGDNVNVPSRVHGVIQNVRVDSNDERNREMSSASSQPDQLVPIIRQNTSMQPLLTNIVSAAVATKQDQGSESPNHPLLSSQPLELLCSDVLEVSRQDQLPRPFLLQPPLAQCEESASSNRSGENDNRLTETSHICSQQVLQSNQDETRLPFVTDMNLGFSYRSPLQSSQTCQSAMSICKGEKKGSVSRKHKYFRATK